MNVIYSLSTLSEWVEIAQNMKERENWNPVLWLSTDVLIPQINQCFPECKVEEYMAGNRGELKNFFFDSAFNPLDNKKISAHLKTEKTVLKMMDRMDPTQRNFTYVERSTLYYKLLTYWTYIFDTHDIDYVLFNEMPHFPLDYVLYAVAKERGVSILRFSPTHMQSRVLLAGELEKTPKYLEDDFAQRKVPSKEIMEYMKRLAGDYSQAVPFYMKQVSDKTLSFKKVYRVFKQGLWYLYMSPNTALKGKGDFIIKSKFRGIYMGYYRFMGNLYKRQLEKCYRGLMIEVDLRKNYIYVPLHYQPEKTTSPEGGFYVDQYLMVSLISKSLPKGWKVYVKEHVSQFSMKLYGERGRSQTLYENLLSLGNVELVSLSYESFDLIDNAQAVATVTGTSALEAINRGKFALIFGNVWFQSSEGIISISKKEDVLQILEKIKRGEKPVEEKIKSFFAMVDKHSIKAYTAGGSTKDISGLNSAENIENITHLLQNYAGKIA